MELINEVNFESVVMHAKLSVLVAFIDWELDHKNQIELIRELAQEQKPYAKFCLAQMDDSCRLMDKLKVTGTPTFLIFYKGTVKGRMIGVTDREGVKAFLKQTLSTIPDYSFCSGKPGR